MSNPKRFTVLALLALAGCGFTPVYGGNAGSVASAKLDQVQVANIPERTGQLLKIALDQKLHAIGAPDSELYTLSVSFSISQTGIGVQADTSTTRNRFAGQAIWTLTPIGDPDTKLIGGTATAQDALNVIDQQYFASNLETDTVNQQLVDEISTQITTQLAAWFRTHPNS